MNKAKVAAPLKKRKATPRAPRNGSNGKQRANANGNGPLLARDLPDARHDLELAIKRYADLYEFAPFGYIAIDRTGRVEEINLAACELLEAKRQYLVSSPFSLFVLPEDLHVFLDHLVRCRKGEHRVESNLRLRKRNRQTIPVILFSTPQESTTPDGARLYHTAIIDLRERERTEQALRVSQDRYRTLFELVPVAVYACDANGVILEYNRRATELWGQELDSNGTTPRFCGSYRIFHPDGRPMAHEECPMARALRGEKVSAKELEIVVERPDGERRHVLASPRILTNKEGKISGAINCLYDITDRKRSEQALLDKELELERIVTQTPFMLMRCTRDLRYRYVSEAYAKMLGRTSDELAGKPLAESMGKEGLEKVRPYIKRVLAGETVNYEEMIPFRNTHPRFMQAVYVPDKGSDGKITGWIASLLDVTERKKQEQRFTEQARLLDLTYDAIMVRDFEGKITYWNRGAEEMYGFSAKQALGNFTHELLQTHYPEDRDNIFRKLRRDRRWSGELNHVRRDGKTITVLSRWSLDRTAKSETILETNTDITDRKNTERLLAEAARQQAALYEMVQRRQLAKSVDDVYQAALDAIISALGCARASILLFNERKVMRFVAWRGLSEKYRRAVEGHSPWKLGQKEAKPVCVEDVDLADLPKGLKGKIRAEGIRAAAFIPLISSRGVIGKFMAYYKERHRFTRSELEVAMTIARQVALGIEHKKGDEALRASEERLRAIVEQTTAGMARTDLKGRFRFVNERFAQMLGCKASELIAHEIAAFVHPEDQKETRQQLDALVTRGAPYESEKRYLRKDGSTLWVNVSASPVLDSNGRPESAVAVVVDVTSRKKAEAALQKSKQMLEQLVQQRTRALRLANAELENEIRRRKGLEGQILEISDREQERLGQELHDGLCQQLTAIGFLARATALRLRDHRVVQHEDLEKIAQLINSSVMDARNIARDLHKEQIGAAELIQALRDLVERKIWQTSCRLELKTAVEIEDDNVASQLYRILREAIINGNKHARATQIVLEVKRSRNYLVFSVIDNGVGLNRKSKGQGLGFHIMKYRAESIGARLELESMKKGGTRMACYLPIEMTK
ncbi:MAG TPA: PAS domain S-box protein [Chthoniobacterales bacterium]|jgi:PAS domain S-box-containing protein|nr:PAS domain S-box protein [Chthoniobacterales bacterium]